MADGSVEEIPYDAWIHDVEYLPGGKSSGTRTPKRIHSGFTPWGVTVRL